jgi:nitroreductase
MPLRQGESTDAITAVLAKRDVRHYRLEAITPEHEDRLVQAARMAGSAKNVEANRLMLVMDPAVKTALVAAGDFSTWIDTAPLIVGFVTRNDW